MNKINFFYSLLICVIFIQHIPAQNFELKNSGVTPIWYSVGDKKHEPMNLPFEKLDKGNSIKKNIEMKDYPELIVSLYNPEPGIVVYYYNLDPYKVKKENLEKKKMYVTVKAVAYTDKETKKTTIYPQVEPQNIKSNISKNELESSGAYYRPTNLIQLDIQQKAYNVIDQAFDRKQATLSANSTPLEILGIREIYPSAQKIINQHAGIVNSLSYLRNQPDMIDVYQEAIKILDKARDDMLVNK